MTPETFEAHRDHLVGVAYRLLGSRAEAEDVVQDAWGRVADRDGVDRPRAYLTRVVTRLGLDALTSARARREVYVGPWLPEPWVGQVRPEDPRLASSLSMATLALLERLSAKERAAFLLRDVFDQDYAEIAETLESSPAAVRQLVRRARAHLASSPRFEATDADRQALFDTLREAFASGDEARLLGWLAEDVVGLTDGGGVVQAARVPIVGAERLAKALRGFRARLPPSATFEVVWVNGDPGFVVRVGGDVFAVHTLMVSAGRVVRWLAVLEPSKLVRVAG